MRTLAIAVARCPWPDLLPARRAAGKAQPAGSPSLLDAMPLGPGRWLAIITDSQERIYPVPLVETTHGVRRARAGDGAAEALVGRFLEGTHEEGQFLVTSWHAEPAVGEQPIDVDQTNESIVIGARAVLKWNLVAEAGPHPAASLLAELERQHFTGTPRPWGMVQWRPSPGSSGRLVASVVSLLRGAVDGWTWAVEDMSCAVAAEDESVVAGPGGRVGRLVADFHLALAGTARRAAIHEVGRWAVDAEADLARALDVTSGHAHGVLSAHASAVRAAWTELPAEPAPLVMRVHGDLHVGQVLRYATSTGAAYAVADFDGNPVTPFANRVLEQPSAVDVAGLLQSLRHAALVMRRHQPDHDPVVTARMSAVMCTSFLDSYRRVLADAGQSRLFDDRLIGPLSLRQVCREFTYAATHLPQWSYVPEAALPALIQAGGAQ